ncbi:hypothetical protein CCAX7_35770 [Capsulimonas corticalis]|uniref:Uncharacterized protein n=2 Tax=Capsulimonas corticalis TaxID=2219043 RepID=A0A402D660_9BACT|nr:hypothetical protein CCAX7_35770 [Capsulimonas corticalis]
MLTLRYRRSLKDVARDAYSAADGLDMTQTVFGYVGNDNSIPPVRSRIAFEDALLVAAPNGIWMEVSAVRIPDILSSPKPTSIQTYLTQSTSEVEPLRHWDSPNVRIRGAKRYWQRSPSSAENSLRTAGDMAIGTQQTKIKPIRAQVKFKGRVRFTNLTSVELAALYASIQLPEGLAHKFGMGKNLGLGALDVSIVKVNLIDTERRYRTLDNAESYHSEEYGRTKLVDGYTELIKRIYPNSKLEKQTSLWNSRRLKDFAGLCSWEVRLEDDLTRQVAIQDSRNDTDEDTWKHNDDQWRRRLVLPSASDLIQEGRLMRQPSDVITPRLEKMIAAKTFPAVAATQQTKFEYKVGDSVTGRILPGYIVELLDTSGSSTGVRLRNLPVMMHATGDILQFKVVELRDGKISRVKKA